MATRPDHQILRRRDCTPVERSDPACKRIDETIQLYIRESTIDVSITLGRVAVEVMPAENDFERTTAADQMR